MAGLIDEVMDGIKDGKPAENTPAVPAPAAKPAEAAAAAETPKPAEGAAPADIQYWHAFRQKYGERKK